jgi:hypothetical protein
MSSTRSDQCQKTRSGHTWKSSPNPVHDRSGSWSRQKALAARAAPARSQSAAASSSGNGLAAPPAPVLAVVVVAGLGFVPRQDWATNRARPLQESAYWLLTKRGKRGDGSNWPYSDDWIVVNRVRLFRECVCAAADGCCRDAGIAGRSRTTPSYSSSGGWACAAG